MRDPPRSSRPAALVAGAALVTLAGLALGGCLTYETADLRIVTDSTHVQHAFITLQRLESTERAPAGRRADFTQLVNDATGEEQLLRAVRSNAYLRDRRLYLEGGVLCARCEFLCRDSRAIDSTLFDHEPDRGTLRVRVDARDSVLATNATAHISGDTLFLAWPDSLPAKWVRIRSHRFEAEPAFAALYARWVRGGGSGARP